MQLFSNSKSSFVTTGVKAALILMGATLLPVSVSHAVPFTPDISITGSTDFDGGFLFAETTPGTLVNGSFHVIEAGAITDVLYDEFGVLGPNPLPGTLTDIGDGFGFAGRAQADFDSSFGIGIDTALSLGNSSATDTYEVIFELAFSNHVIAEGGGAYSDSELTVDIGLLEVFFSDLISDSFYGNEQGGIFTGGFGGPLDESSLGFLLPTITLTPGDSETLDLSWTAMGGTFPDLFAEVDLSTFLSVASVTNVTRPTNDIPEPGTFFLLGAGLLGLPLLRKARCG